MHLTRIFVSSTCYDLADVRKSLQKHISCLGHDPVLSEFNSFPIRPDENTITNCRLNVKHRCDAIVLIVGGKRGYLDPATGKSVTNLEYSEAKAAGKPCFVFIDKTVLDLLPLWKEDPSTDFTPQVDYPDVFKFVDAIRSGDQWTFSFSSTQEIEETLSIQLSGLLRDLMERHRAGTLDPVTVYLGESQCAQKLVRDRPKFWEFLLVSELLNTKLAQVREKYEQVKNGQTYVQSKSITGEAFVSWVMDQLANAVSLSEALSPIVRNYPKCWGPPGESGNPQEILFGTNELVNLVEQVVEWERSIRSIRTHAVFSPLKTHMSGILESILEEMEALQKGIAAPFANGNVPADGSKIQIDLELKLPNLEGFYGELKALERIGQQKPQFFKEIWNG